MYTYIYKVLYKAIKGCLCDSKDTAVSTCILISRYYLLSHLHDVLSHIRWSS